MNSDHNKTYIVGNWKMNPVSRDDAETIFDEIENDVYKIESKNTETVICVPYLFLSEFDSDGKVRLGAQNVFWEKQGAYTGEISADMLRRAGAKYVIIGHSERRYYLGETDEMTNAKVSAALEGSLKPILCVGETLDEKKNGYAEQVVIRQVEKALAGISGEEIFGRLIIAYEPVWAISSNMTGMTPSVDDIMSTGLLVRKVLAKIHGNRELAENTPVLYGGSVNAHNAFDFVDKTGLNGLLIGSVSLNPKEFVEVVKKFERR